MRKMLIPAVAVLLCFSACKRKDIEVEKDVSFKLFTIVPDCTMHVTDGVVYISGIAKTDSIRIAAGNAARTVSGVRNVVNRLIVLPPRVRVPAGVLPDSASRLR